MLATDGFEIWLNYKSDHQAAQEVARKVKGIGRKCVLLPFDVSDSGGSPVPPNTLLENETPYALVNNAGFNKDVIMAWMTSSEWSDVLKVNLNGFNVTNQY